MYYRISSVPCLAVLSPAKPGGAKSPRYPRVDALLPAEKGRDSRRWIDSRTAGRLPEGSRKTLII